MQNSNSLIEWRLSETDISGQCQPQPYSVLFQDVYYSSDDGLQETDYVFLQGNQLAQRWQQLSGDSFTIIETGFGTGLNFLCAAQLWLQTAPVNARLHFISVEKYPLTLPEITTALATWPTLSALSTLFLKEYPDLTQKNTAFFDKRVQLTLLIGDATACLSKMATAADAWFLDGFSPAKNPEMWQPTLFAQMSRLSKAGTTFATFTSAGAVRRGLQAAGFAVHKQAGFGKKREMLTGYLMADATLDNPRDH